MMDNREVHICPLLMRTVILEDGQCSEKCSEECPIMISTQECIFRSASHICTAI